MTSISHLTQLADAVCDFDDFKNKGRFAINTCLYQITTHISTMHANRFDVGNLLTLSEAGLTLLDTVDIPTLAAHVELLHDEIQRLAGPQANEIYGFETNLPTTFPTHGSNENDQANTHA